MTRTKRGRIALDLFVLRHGEAGTPLDNPAKDDERPLTREGRQEMREVARAMRKLGIKFDLIASSPLPRALQTAEALGREYRKLKSLEKWDELKYSAETEGLYRKLARQKQGSRVLVVGHEPHLSGMMAEVTAGTAHVNFVLKKSGLAKIGVLSFRPKTTGELHWLLTPKLMKRAS